MNDVGNIHNIWLVCLLLPLNQLNSTLLLIFLLETWKHLPISDHNFVYQGLWKYDDDVCWSNTTLLYFLHLRSAKFILDHNFVYEECIKAHTFYWIVEWRNLIYFSFTFVIALIIEWMKDAIRGHSTTTWTEFCLFLTPPPPAWTVL